jgi:hypothetical protein
VLTTDPVHLPPETTWHLMTNLPGKLERSVGNTFGLRTWIESGCKHVKDDLGWADYRLTDAHSIARWWELVLCAYLLVSLQAPVFAPADAPHVPATPNEPLPPPPLQHPAWTAPRLDRRRELETSPHQFAAAAPALRLCRSPAALAASLSLAAPVRWLGRPLCTDEYLPPALPTLTEEGHIRSR